MIYGYVDKVADKNSGLSQMREVTFAADAESLRKLALFLKDAADQLDAEPRSVLWHRHVPNELRDSLECDVIVCAPNVDDDPETLLPVLDL